MTVYTESDLLRLAKRFHNTKRTYLLVNPLQGKHLAVSPTKALEMFGALGKKIKESYEGTGLVIGFAETATAVGMAVAEEISQECIYIHTTREEVPQEDKWIEFCEEHSHAVDQKLSCSRVKEWIGSTQNIVFVDDEISTGKTLINFVIRLKELYPEIEGKKLIAASLINRVSEENRKKMEGYGIECVSLLKMDELDYTEAVKKYTIEEAKEPKETEADVNYQVVDPQIALADPRLGISVRDYVANVKSFAASVIEKTPGLNKCKSVLVMGTEECMYPAIVLGAEIEKRFDTKVFTHSATRSPIGICSDEGYPVQSGYKLKSLYEDERITYIYNLKKYDQVMIVTDSKNDIEEASTVLKRALCQSGNKDILLVRG